MSAVYSKLHKARSSTGCSGFVAGSVDGSMMCVRKTSGALRLHRGSRVVPRLGVTLVEVAGRMVLVGVYVSSEVTVLAGVSSEVTVLAGVCSEVTVLASVCSEVTVLAAGSLDVVVLTAVGAVFRVVRRSRLNNTLAATVGFVVFSATDASVAEAECVAPTDVVLADCFVTSTAVDVFTSVAVVFSTSTLCTDDVPVRAVAATYVDWSVVSTDWLVVPRDWSVVSTDLSVVSTDWSVVFTGWSVVSTDWSVVFTNWSVVCRYWSVVSTDWSVICTDWSVVSTYWSVVPTDWSVVCTDLSVVSTYWSVVSRNWSAMSNVFTSFPVARPVVDDSGVTVRGTVDRGSDSDNVKHINIVTRCVV